jgi:exportin-T
VHHPLTQVRKRVFYLFYRFVQALRIDIKVEHVPAILQAIQDLMTFDVEIPEDFEPPAGTTEENFLTEVLKEPSMFDTQLYMFEAAGALVSALWQQPENQAAALQTIMNPLLSRLSSSLQIPLTRTPDDYLNILAVHHSIQALGSIPKGFPEFPSPVPDDYIMPPLTEFRQMAEAILFSLTIMGQYRVIREAVSSGAC